MDNMPHVYRKPKLVKLPLKNFCFLVSCTADKNKVEQWTKKIIECGGEVVSRGTTKVAALITTQGQLDETCEIKSNSFGYILHHFDLLIILYR